MLLALYASHRLDISAGVIRNINRLAAAAAAGPVSRGCDEKAMFAAERILASRPIVFEALTTGAIHKSLLRSTSSSKLAIYCSSGYLCVCLAGRALSDA